MAGSPLARKLGAFVALSGPELAAIDVFHQRRRSFEPGVDLVQQGQLGQLAYILADGWVCSFKLLSNGTRQIVDFQVPGDFLGLRSVLFRTSDHQAEAMTKVEVSEVSPDDLLKAFVDVRRDLRDGGTLGSLTRRGDGSGTPGWLRPGAGVGANGTFPAGTWSATEVGRIKAFLMTAMPAHYRSTCWPTRWV